MQLANYLVKDREHGHCVKLEKYLEEEEKQDNNEAVRMDDFSYFAATALIFLPL